MQRIGEMTNQEISELSVVSNKLEMKNIFR